MDFWHAIETRISHALGRPLTLEEKGSVGGGCINEAYRLQTSTGSFFLKLHDAGKLAMFEAEADGLKAILETGAIRAPKPLCQGTAGGRAYLVMEYVPFGRGTNNATFGEQLARMHQTAAPRFGWHRDNTIGSTPQINTWEDSWAAFWREHRLGYQLALAKDNGASRGLLGQGERLLEAFPALFTDYRPQPSLLHGDLWSGNYDTDATGRPVIFDPATYYGDRETDLAMTELFGGPGRDFYAAYHAAYPIDPGYAVRKQLYHLYHLLNHFNLFGGGYAAQAEHMAGRLLSELH